MSAEREGAAVELRTAITALGLAGTVGAGCVLYSPYLQPWREDASVELGPRAYNDVGVFGDRSEGYLLDAPRFDVVPNTYFQSCMSSSSCLGNGARCDTNFPGGSCTGRCTTARACGEGAACDGTECYRACTLGGGECGPTQRCVRMNESTRVCVAACSATPEEGTPGCLLGTVCDPYTNFCTNSVALRSGINGAPCGIDGACSSFECLRDVGEDRLPTGFLDGYCVSFARQPAAAHYQGDRPWPEGTCPRGSVAVPSEAGSGEGDNTICLASCTTSGQCRAGYFCNKELPNRSAQASTGFCTPIDCLAEPYASMANAGCPTGTACVHRTYEGSSTVTGVCARP